MSRSMLGSLPAVLLRCEGLAVLAAALVLYFDRGFGWILLLVLVLAPDLSMVGYLAGPTAGALAYNAVHTYVPAIVLGMVGILSDADLAVQLALIWLAHIGADRLLGYGLKYPASFKDTHLQRV
jgi:hypothetical protein